jgi:hypothetical protein
MVSGARAFALMGLALAVGICASHGDIAPTQFVGYGVSPTESHGLRMVSAKVDIVWGTPCKLAGTFVIENRTGKPADINLGFPLTNYDYPLNAPKPQPLTFVFDGAPVVCALTVHNKTADKPEGSVWYRCPHTFKRGRTTVVVKTDLNASLDESFPREHIFYCIETGGYWNGTIGSEEVAIHFPTAIIKEQIIAANPGGEAIDGDTVRWTFTDFKPKGKDHDIELIYLRPDIVSVLAKVRDEHQHDLSNSGLILKLAKDLFALGPEKGYGSYTPEWLAREEFANLLARIKDPQDKALAQSRYAFNPKAGKYEEKDDDKDPQTPFGWSVKRVEMVRILNAANYHDPYWQTPFVDEARTLVENLLNAEPTNAEAWNVYFANYYRFRFGGDGNIAYYPDEIERITKAVAICPNDPGLRLWYKVITQPHGPQTDSNLAALNDYEKKMGITDNDYPKHHYDYF